VKVCLLSPGLPGTDPGDAVGAHARGLAARDGVEVTLALTQHRPGGARGAAVGGARAVAVEDAIAAGGYDVAVATDWTSTARLFEVPATRHAYWVDGFAHHRIGAWNAERIAAQLSYDLPVDFLAASEAVAAGLADLRPEARCLVVRGGVDKAVFAPDGAAPAAGGGPLRVVIVELPEDDPGREWAAGALAEAAEPHRASTLPAGAAAAARAAAFREADVVVMLSAVDGVLRAPLEAMHCGATVIVMPVAETPELVRHAENGIVAEPDDVRGAGRWLDHLARDGEWLGRLRGEASATAAAWPSADDAAGEMAAALARLVAEPPPQDARWPVRLMADAMAGVAVYRNDHFVLAGELKRIQDDEAYQAATALRDRLRSSPRLAGLRRVAAPAARAARKRLG
jgi:O-antigen biosynthesis protein